MEIEKMAFIFRHAKNNGRDSGLSREGMQQAATLAKSLVKKLEGNKDKTIIITSPTKRGVQTGLIIKNELELPESTISHEEKLSPTNSKATDWLAEKVKDFFSKKTKHQYLVFIAHAKDDVVTAKKLGFEYANEDCWYAQGVLITEKGCVLFK